MDDPPLDLEQLFEDFRTRADVKALAQVFDAAAPELHAIARFLARREGEAEDLVQQTFLIAIERAASFDARKSLMPWLLGILAMQAKKRAERRDHDRHDGGRDEHVLQSREDPEREAESHELRDAVTSAVASLPEKQQRILTLHLVEDRSPREIAAVLALEPGTARVQLHRALKLLRASFPTGFASALVAPAGSLDAVRTRVLESARPIAPLAPASLAPGVAGALKIALLTAIVLGVTGSAWLAAPLVKSMFGSAPTIAALEPERAGEARSATQEHALATDASDARASSAPVRPVVRKSPSASMIGPDAELYGRLLRPDGSPAAGAKVALRGSESNRSRVEEYGVPQDWKNPAPVFADAEGRFRITLAPPRAFQFLLYATLEHCARISWRWGELTGQHIDLGDARFQPACTIVVRVVDPSGVPMERKYEISARPAVEPSGEHRENVSCRSSYDPDTHMGLLEDVPVGRVTVSAQSALSDKIPEVIVEAKPDQPVQIDLVDSSPLASTRIVVDARTNPFYSFPVEALHVLLRRDAEEPRHAESSRRGSRRLVFDSLAPGDYSLEIDDPRYEHWVKPDVKPGEVVRADLKPSAVLHVEVRSAATHEPVEPSVLRIQYVHVNFSPATFDLVARGSAVSKDALYPAVPGECEIVVEAPGFPVQSFALGELLPHERRDVAVELKPGLVLRGHVLAADGHTPTSDIAVQLTRGTIAGHTLGRGAEISAWGGRIPSIEASTQSDADGAFAFDGLAPGRFTLRAVWSPWLVVDRTFDAHEGDASAIDLAEPPSGFLEGAVLLPEGAVHDGLEIELRSEDTKIYWPAQYMLMTTGVYPGVVPPNGRFRFGPLPVGRLSAVLMIGIHGPLGQSAYGTESVKVEIESGQTTLHDFDVRATMGGRVKIAVLVDGVAATGGMADCTRLDDDPQHGGAGSSLAGDGTALYGGIAPGRWHLWIDAEDKSWTWLDPEELDLGPGQQLDIEARIDLAEHAVRLFDSRDGSPLARHEIQVATGHGLHELVSTKPTDERGIVKLKLPIGPVTFRDHATKAAVTMDWGRDAADPMDVRLKPKD